MVVFIFWPHVFHFPHLISDLGKHSYTPSWFCYPNIHSKIEDKKYYACTGRTLFFFIFLVFSRTDTLRVICRPSAFTNGGRPHAYEYSHVWVEPPTLVSLKTSPHESFRPEPTRWGAEWSQIHGLDTSTTYAPWRTLMIVFVFLISGKNYTSVCCSILLCSLLVSPFIGIIMDCKRSAGEFSSTTEPRARLINNRKITLLWSLHK